MEKERRNELATVGCMIPQGREERGVEVGRLLSRALRDSRNKERATQAGNLEMVVVNLDGEWLLSRLAG